MRTGAGLDAGLRVRRGKIDDWKYIYVEEGERPENITEPLMMPRPSFALKTQPELDPSGGFTKKRNVEWEPHLLLPPPPKYQPFKDLPEPCDEENPRIFHMFWTGPFTDKPYLALLSFLYTQNVGLHLEEGSPDPRVCRPKF